MIDEKRIEEIRIRNIALRQRIDDRKGYAHSRDVWNHSDIAFLLAAYGEQVNITIDCWGENAELQAENAELQADNDRLRQALEPFVRYGRDLPVSNDNVPAVPLNGYGDFISFGDFSRAADAVKGDSDE